MLGWGYQHIFQPTHFADMSGMVPELGKQMYWSQNGYHHMGHTQDRRWYKKQGKVTYQVTYRLPKCTGQIKLLTAMVNYMLIPKNINFMA
jgi:hypothetical protein